MGIQTYKYIIVGAGLAGVSAAKAIRELDKEGSILLVGREHHPPYQRPALSKTLWFEDKAEEEIFIEPPSFYEDNRIQLKLGTSIVKIDPKSKTVSDDRQHVLSYDKLLIATGGVPRRLEIPGEGASDICYYRNMDDYKDLSRRISPSTRALVIGGGFIGCEMAAAVSTKAKQVSMLFPESHMGASIFPAPLASAIESRYRDRGIELISEDRPASIERSGDRFIVATQDGKRLMGDIVIAGIGIRPEIQSARDAGLEVDDGIVVSARLETSQSDIYAAGDNARFYYPALGQRRRIEHWDCAESQGAFAGRNMAGDNSPYTSLPYFFSDLFDFGYEAVGDTDPRMDVRTVWETPNEKGIVYYLDREKVRGAMLCNVWDKVDDIRALIESGREMSRGDLERAVTW